MAALAGGPACAQQPAAGSGDGTEPLAVVDGQPIREADLDTGGALLQLEQQAYRVRMQALEEAVAERVIAAEAERRGVSVDELLEAEVETSEPTEAEIQTFYERQKGRINRPLEDVREQVRQFLVEQSKREAREQFVAGLREKSDVKILLSPPRLPVELADAPIRGAADAPVTIVEFSDFQCPFCRRVQPTLSELQERYGDKLRWSFKDLPLNDIHPEAAQAAQAARCAGEQDKFWEYRAELFEAQRITSGMHDEIAAELGLELEPFQQCLESGRYADEVEQDSAEAAALGISGTPAFLVNGILISGAQPLEAFTEVIDRELDRAQ